MIQKLIAIIMVLGVTACGGSEHGEPIMNGSEGEGGLGGEMEITFAQDIGPLMEAKCARCHSAYTNYEVVAGSIESISFRVLETMTMPPRSQPQLTDEEKELLAVWIEEGLKQE